jgi:predicted lipid-binding transport protein (Tim44 family)
MVLAGRSRELYTRKDTRMSEQEPQNHPASDQEPHNQPAAPMAIGSFIGAIVGTLVGVLLSMSLDDTTFMALGGSTGIGLGMTLGILWKLRKQRKHDDS